MAKFVTPDGAEVILQPLTFGAILKIEDALGFSVGAIVDEAGQIKPRVLRTDSLTRFIYEIMPREELKARNLGSYSAFAEYAVQHGKGEDCLVALINAFQSAYAEFMGVDLDLDDDATDADPTHNAALSE